MFMEQILHLIMWNLQKCDIFAFLSLKFSHYLLTSMLIENQVMFRSPQNMFGASQHLKLARTFKMLLWLLTARPV